MTKKKKPSINLDGLTRTQKVQLLEMLNEMDERLRYNKLAQWFPDDGPFARKLYRKQVDFMNAGLEFKERCLFGGNRPLSEDTLVCMHDGSKKPLFDVKVGDKVLALDLKTRKAVPTHVVAIPYTGLEECFEIETSRGQKVEATKDHCFPVWNKSGKQKSIRKMQVSELKTDLSVSKRKGLITPDLIEYQEKGTLDIHPYVIGCLLGDGCLHQDSIRFTNIDQQVINKFSSLSPGTVYKNSTGIVYTITQGLERCATTGQFVGGKVNGILDDLGLKVRGELKFIPNKYLTASVKDRLELLAGLIDTDGCIDEFTSKSEQLVKDFCHLVSGLGGYAKYSQVEKTCTNNGVKGIYYRAYWRLLREIPLARKDKQASKTLKQPDYQRHPIRQVKSVGVKKVRCITIAHDDHVFLVNDNIATYNSGKSTVGAYELALHLTGLYPEWWEGRRFDEPTMCWAAGDNHLTVRDIAQFLLLGSAMDMGSGMIPKHLIVETKTKMGIPNAISDVWVKHVSGGVSQCSFKSYEQGRKSFQGTAQHVVWLDEECPQDVYSECLTRTMTTNGCVFLTFTPLNGLTPTVEKFLPGGVFPDVNVVVDKDGLSRYITRVDWEDVPHLPEDEKKKLAASYMPHEREARMKGIPMIGSGKIYPIPEADFIIPPFIIPNSWPRAYGLDVGYHCTAAVWGAYDEQNDVVYIYDEYYCSQGLPVLHAESIRRKGSWIPGVVDPSAGRGNSRDGLRLIDEYKDYGLDLAPATNAIESGITEILNRLATGRLKVFLNCQNTIGEYRVYRRNDRGEVAANQKDHAMDALRYLIVSGIRRADIRPDDRNDQKSQYSKYKRDHSRNDITGY